MMLLIINTNTSKFELLLYFYIFKMVYNLLKILNIRKESMINRYIKILMITNKK